MVGSSGSVAAGSTATGAAAPLELPVAGGSRSIRIRTFDGDRAAGAYEAWKDEVQTLMHIYTLSQKDMAPLVYLALEAGVGKPRDLMRHLSLVDDVIQDKGVDTLLSILDDEFRGKPYRRAEEATSRYYRTRREQGETMADYVSKLKVAKRTLELEDSGSNIFRHQLCAAIAGKIWASKARSTCSSRRRRGSVGSRQYFGRTVGYVSRCARGRAATARRTQTVS